MHKRVRFILVVMNHVHKSLRGAIESAHQQVAYCQESSSQQNFMTKHFLGNNIKQTAMLMTHPWSVVPTLARGYLS